MGAVNFSLDERLVAALQAGLPLRTFVETGTFKGDTLARLLPCFDVLHSVELSTPLWMEAVARFAEQPKVVLSNASSPDFLVRLNTTLAGSSTLYWLDAHWCAVEDVAGETSQCPLLEELRAIGSLAPSSAILIDDARLFLAPPAAPHEVSQWPRFHEIVTTLLSLSSSHEIMVINDVIAFFPSHVRPFVEAYAQAAGVDWVAAAGRVHELVENEAALRDKEAVIQSSAQSLGEKEVEIHKMAESLVEKEAEIQRAAQSLIEKETEIQRFVQSLTEKETEIQAMSRSLIEKERVIQELAAAQSKQAHFARAT